MTDEEIHNIYLHMCGKAEGIAEATGSADFPVLFARAILKYSKREWVGLENSDIKSAMRSIGMMGQVNDGRINFAKAIEAKLKEKNGG